MSTESRPDEPQLSEPDGYRPMSAQQEHDQENEDLALAREVLAGSAHPAAHDAGKVGH
jgi:hypothetical protein